MSPSGEGVIGGTGPEGGKVGNVAKFRATRVAASNSCSVALNEAGELRVWGSFRVRFFFLLLELWKAK